MKRLMHATVTLATLLATVAPGSTRSYLYRPEPLDGNDPVTSPRDAILVREITIEKGDTLFGLARRHIGRGIYYPQILLFNQIDNPNLIYAGRTIRIPVPSTPPVTPPPAAVETRPLPEPVVPSPVQTKPHAAAAKPAPEPPAASPPPPSDAGPDLYASAVAAYKSGNCRTAVDLIDRYLSRFPDSPLSADLLLYRADCYLTLSGE